MLGKKLPRATKLELAAAQEGVEHILLSVLGDGLFSILTILNKEALIYHYWTKEADVG